MTRRRGGRGFRIENLKNYRPGYRYSPQLKRWVSPKTGQGVRRGGISAAKMVQRMFNKMRGIKIN